MSEKNNALLPIPQGDYVAASRHDNLIMSAGMTPRQNGELLYKGRIRKCDSIEQYKEAVQLACANALNAVLPNIKSDEELACILHLIVYINADAEFEAHSRIADLASAYLKARIGDAGVASRSAIGVTSLPGNAPVEIQITGAIRKINVNSFPIGPNTSS